MNRALMNPNHYQVIVNKFQNIISAIQSITIQITQRRSPDRIRRKSPRRSNEGGRWQNDRALHILLVTRGHRADVCLNL